MNDSNTLNFSGQATSEDAPFVHFDGQPHTRLEAGVTLLHRPGDTVVTIVGLPDLLQEGSLLVLG
jgi:hypothetical protein